MGHADNVLQFPTKRKAPYRHPRGWWNQPLPPNLVPIRRPPPPQPPQVLPPVAYVVLALIEALRDKPSAWRRTGGPDVLGHLPRLRARWQGDDELKPYLDEALRIILARRTGRRS
jgi:hypothetical protein